MIRLFFIIIISMRWRLVLTAMQENRLLLMQILSFVSGKILFGTTQLPQYQKTESYLAELIVAFLFYASSFVLKLISIPRIILTQVVMVNLRSFLLWIVTVLIMIFSFTLSQTLGWNSFQIILLQIIIFLQTAVLILLSNWRYTSKVEFVVYELILSVNILILGIKTVLFISYEEDRSNKDIVLLNLTTEIAFTIFVMDSIERAYKRYF